MEASILTFLTDLLSPRAEDSVHPPFANPGGRKGRLSKGGGKPRWGHIPGLGSKAAEVSLLPTSKQPLQGRLPRPPPSSIWPLQLPASPLPSQHTGSPQF